MERLQVLMIIKQSDCKVLEKLVNNHKDISAKVYMHQKVITPTGMSQEDWDTNATEAAGVCKNAWDIDHPA